MTYRPKLVILAALMVCGSAGAQRDFSQVRIEPIKVAEGIYMLQGQGGNIGPLPTSLCWTVIGLHRR